MDLLLLAWRYLVARPITLVSMLSVTVGLAAIVVVDSVMNGFLAEQHAMVRALSPDVSIDLGKLDRAASETLLDEVRAFPGVAAASGRVEVPALQSPAGKGSEMNGVVRLGADQFVELVGVERHLGGSADAPPEAVPLAPFLLHERCDAGMFEGRCPFAVARVDDPFWFDPDDAYWRDRMASNYRHRDDLVPLLLGERLALDCGYRIGTVLTMRTLAGDLEGTERMKVRDRQFVLAGTFVTRDRHFDLTHALAPREELVEFAGLASPLQEIALRASDGDETALRDRLRRALSLPPDAIETWADRKSLLLGAVETERRSMNVAMFFVVIVATFSLFMTLHQMVRRKTRDLGILAALGSTPLRAGKLFLLCGFFVTVAGAGLGLGGGLALAHWLNPILDLIERITGFTLFDQSLFPMDGLPVRVDSARILWYALGTVVCGTLFTLLPSLRAARLQPVEALRHE